jgi:sugar phosphate isomerase/epimerase
MSNRRDFLRQSGALALGSWVAGQVSGLDFSDKKRFELGVQLFTFFAVIDNDTPGTLKKLAALGYKNIESAFSRQGGFYGQKPKEFAKTLEDLGMRWRAHHVLGAPFKLPPGAKMPTDDKGNPIQLPPMKNLKENMQEMVDSVAEGGVKYLVCANIPINSTEELADAVQILTKTGEAAKKAGLQLVYHNHDAEFRKINDTTAYDVFLSQIPADLMKMELDLAWAIKAGVDPVALFERHPGRFPLWHVKDIDKDLLVIKPVGEGIVDFKRIFNHAKTAGLKYPFVEHDMPADPFDSLSRSKAYLKKNIFK